MATGGVDARIQDEILERSLVLLTEQTPLFASVKFATHD
jgi:hypothetical protein